MGSLVNVSLRRTLEIDCKSKNDLIMGSWKGETTMHCPYGAKQRSRSLTKHTEVLEMLLLQCLAGRGTSQKVELPGLLSSPHAVVL